MQLIVSEIHSLYHTARAVTDVNTQTRYDILFNDELSWKKCGGVLCDRTMPVKLEGKKYRRVVWPAFVYGAET